MFLGLCDGLTEPAIVAVAMVCGGVSWLAVLDITRAIACDTFYWTSITVISSFFAATIPTLFVL